MPTVRTNDIDLYYEEHGSGEPLLLIMGWGGNAATWKPQLPGLADHYRVIVFDNRGVGRSSAPDDPYTISQLASDAAGLLDELDILRAHVFGISLGGMIAQELALRYPERVEGLVLGCTTPGGDLAAGAEQLHEDIASFQETMEGGGTDLEWFSDFLRRLWTEESLAAAHPYLQDFVFSLIRFPPTTHGLRHQAHAVSRHDVYDELHLIPHRTLVITGDEDELIHPHNATLLAERIPNAKLLIFQGLKHAFHLERPDEVNAAIIEFLGIEAPVTLRNGRQRAASKPT